MKNKLLGVKILSIFISFAVLLFLIPGCGDGGGGGGGKTTSKISGKKPVGSFIGHVNAKTGEVTFEYSDGSTVKTKKGNAKKLYTSQPGPGMPGLQVTLASAGMAWDSTNKILTGNVTITNNTSDTLYGTYATIESISAGGVSVNNEYGYDPSGYPYFNHAPAGASIAASATGSAVTWKFSDPSSASFNFSGNVYADNWHQIAGHGIASTAWENADADKEDKLFIDSMTNFNGKLYLTLGKQVHPARDTGSANDFRNGGGAGVGITGAEIWEFEPTSSVWTKVSAPGFGGAEDYLNFAYSNWGTSLLEYKGSLYAGTSKATIFGNGQTDPDNKQGAEIWQWSGSGTAWSKVHSLSDCKAIKDLLEFDGNIFATGYFRGYNKAGAALQSRFDFSPTGTTGWAIVMSDSFGDIDEQGTYGTSISSAISNVQFGTSNKFLFMAKGGITAKPGAQIYRAGPANGTNKGTNYTNGLIVGARGNGNWTTNGDWTRITDVAGDDFFATITSTPVLINGAAGMFTIASVTYSSAPADHELAHHWAHNDTQGRSSITIIDNVGTSVVYGVHAGDHTPKYKNSLNGVGDKLRLTKGANERGASETANGTSFELFTFAPSTEGTASPVDNTLGVSTNNLPQGLPNYNTSGAEMYASSNAGISTGTVDSDWVRKLDLFTGVNGSALGFATPGASGGANFEGLSSIGGFNNRDDFTFAMGSHEGWLYASVYPFQKTDSGFRLYKSADGINWIKITDDNFGRKGYSKGFTFVSLNGKLYMSMSRQQFSTSVSGSSDGAAGLTTTTSTFYVTDPTFGTPTIRFPASGTLVLDKVIAAGVDPGNNVPESAIIIEKVNYTGTRVSTTLTLTNALPANDGTLANYVWATDTQIPLSSVATLPSSGAVVLEGEVIQYGALSGSTLISLERGTRGPKDHGIANHPKGAPVYRTTKNAANDYGIVLSATTGLITSGNARRILIDNEEISYATLNGLTLTTPIRAMDATDAGAHAASAPIYRPGFTGITRGQYGTTLTTWSSGEGVSGGISLGTAELWITE